MTAAKTDPLPQGSDRKTSRRRVYEGSFLELYTEHVHLPNGEAIELEMIRHPGAAAVVPLSTFGEVLLVRQYRHATGGWLLEVPAGKLDDGEAPEACARRETEEEIGFLPGRLESLGWIWTTPGFADERIHLYLATDLRETSQSLGADEVLSVERLPFTAAVEKAIHGEIQDGKTVCALLRAHHLLAARASESA